jgi:outer membrane protein OmpA-like peptidoglycan-associated protein
VAEIVDAWNERSADRFAAALAADVRLLVPPLHLEIDGREEARWAVAALFGSFGALRYTSRHRYLTTVGVTDEVLLEGMQTRDFLGAPPTGRPAAVAARVMMRHDGREVTSLTVWPDVGALRNLSDGVARRIDLRAGAGAASVVASLRATLPSTEGKLSLAHSRSLPQTLLPESDTLLPGAPPPEPVPAAGGGDAKKGRGKDGPKAPLPRKARRRRAIAAGVLMLALTGVVGAWVVQGVGRTKDVPPAAAKPTPTAKAKPTPRPSARPSPSPSPSRSVTFNKETNTFNVPDEVLFEVNQARLQGDAEKALDQVVRALRVENRLGIIVVTGYTDNTGTPEYNNNLSRQRAQAVKRYLLSQLGEDGRWRIRALGRGAEDALNDNSDEKEREANRRVTIRVPKEQGTP